MSEFNIQKSSDVFRSFPVMNPQTHSTINGSWSRGRRVLCACLSCLSLSPCVRINVRQAVFSPYGETGCRCCIRFHWLPSYRKTSGVKKLGTSGLLLTFTIFQKTQAYLKAQIIDCIKEWNAALPWKIAQLPAVRSEGPGIHWDRIILQGWRPSSDAIRLATADLGAVMGCENTPSPSPRIPSR